MSLILGLDSSTQSLSAVVVNSQSGVILAEASLNFGSDFPQYNLESGFIPGGENGEVHSDPLVWLDALDGVLAKLRDEGVPMNEMAKNAPRSPPPLVAEMRSVAVLAPSPSSVSPDRKSVSLPSRIQRAGPILRPFTWSVLSSPVCSLARAPLSTPVMALA